jgi:AbrB family looped-hinge helix DNA binding protein
MSLMGPQRADLTNVANDYSSLRTSRNALRRWLAPGLIAMSLAFLMPSFPFAAITSNSTSSGSTTGATSLTWSHTINSGSNRALFVGISIEYGGSSTGVTYGGTALTLVGRSTGTMRSSTRARAGAPFAGKAGLLVFFTSGRIDLVARSGAAVQMSRVSSKGQVTLPKKVREAIGVGPGDRVAYDVAKGVVTVRRLEPIDLAFHAAVESTLTEWASKEDDEAYGDL